MIRDKLLPSIYLVEVSGDSIASIIPGNFGIAKIALASETFPNDLEAHATMSKVMDHFGMGVPKVDLNPIFFPTLPELELTKQQQEEKEAIDKFLEARALMNEEPAVAVTQFFDRVGDFVVSRSTAQHANGQIVGKVAIEPTAYLREKNFEESANKSAFMDYRDSIQSRIH